MASQEPSRRKLLNLHVKSQLQWCMIGRITGILFVSLLISNAVLYYLANKEINNVLMFFSLEPRNNIFLLLPWLLFSFLFSILTGLTISLFFPKKYAGSLYRIEQDLQHVLDGDLTRKISPRDGDDTCELAEKLNDLIDFFRAEVENIISRLHDAHEMSATDTGLLPEESLKEIKKIHLQLANELKTLEIGLDDKKKYWDKGEWTVYVGEAKDSAN